MQRYVGRLGKVLAASTAAAFVVACGTTVSGQGQAEGYSADQASGVGSRTTTPLGGTPSGSTGATGSADQRLASSNGAAVRSTRTEASVSPGGRGLGSVITGRGVTATKVYVGVATAEDAERWAKAAGIEGLSAGDTQAQVNAVLKDIQRRGGLLGRKIELVVHDFKTASTLTDPATANEAACTDWTQDHQVYVVFAGYDPTLAACLKKTNTPLISAGAWWDTSAVRMYQDVYTRYPNYYLLGGMLGDRVDKMAIEQLVARGYFQKWDTSAGKPGIAPMKLGLIVIDSPPGEISRKSIVKQLARFGIKPTATIKIRMEDLGVSGQQGAVLRFASMGVTHVMGGDLTFMQTADGQQYHPRYYLDAATHLFEENAPESQLRGSMAQSLQPTLDVGASQDPGDPSPATTYCKKVMKAAGQSYSDRSVLWAMEIVCDSFFFLKDAVDKSGELTTTGLRRGLESLGTRPSALTWVSYLGPGNHVSGRSMRNLNYNSACTCFAYTSTKTYTDLEN